MESSPTFTAAEVWGPGCSGVVWCRRWRRRLAASATGVAGQSNRRNMEKRWGHGNTMNILTSNKLEQVFRPCLAGASQASRKCGFGQGGQDAKRCKKPFGSQVFKNSNSPVPGCQMYQSRFGFVLEDLDSINHLDLAQVLQAMKLPAQAAIEALPYNFGATCGRG